MKNSTLFLFLILGISTAAQVPKITPAEAKNHVGEKATVCGNVASTYFASKAKGRPTFLNLDQSYPKAVFTVLIWGTDRPKFGAPEIEYRDAKLCVTGKITTYRGTADITVTKPSQIEVHAEPAVSLGAEQCRVPCQPSG
jgi:hypothetical protein